MLGDVSREGREEPPRYAGIANPTITLFSGCPSHVLLITRHICPDQAIATCLSTSDYFC